MNNKAISILVVAVAVLAAIGGTMNTKRAMAQTGSPRSAPVHLVSPLPVPITGATSVSGTVAADQSGPWNVGITGTPNINVANTPTVNIGNSPLVSVGNSPTVLVGNEASNPVSVRDVGNAKPTPFHTSDVPFLVPVGKRAVIEFVSRQSTGEGGSASDFFFQAGIRTVNNGRSLCHLLLTTTRTLPYTGRNDYLASQVVRIYADPATNIQLCDSYSGPQFFGSVSISGFLEDVP